MVGLFITGLFLSLVGLLVAAHPGATPLEFNLKRATNSVYTDFAAPDVPDQCRLICRTPLTLSEQGCTPQSCCTSSFESEFYNCFLCVGQAAGITDYSVPQQTLNQLQSLCASAGLAIPTLVFPGQPGANSTSSQAPSSATRTTQSIQSTSGVSIQSTSGVSTRSVSPTHGTITQQTVTSVDSQTTAPASSTSTTSDGQPQGIANGATATGGSLPHHIFIILTSVAVMAVL